ncbi:hypothetical protein KSP39_PZI000088 [Platanthera zijinensis]|uniref:Uncharacterized protein n=1 Tax=Platanthera zijinensis TaxID=2320716 RepID=A0AAP0GFV4_9ASPA
MKFPIIIEFATIILHHHISNITIIESQNTPPHQILLNISKAKKKKSMEVCLESKME